MGPKLTITQKGALVGRRCQSLLFGLALTFSAWIPAQAATPALQKSQFGVLHRIAAEIPEASGLKLSLEEGQLEMTAERFQLDSRTLLKGVRVRFPLDTSGDFLASPVTHVLEALVADATMQVERLESGQGGLYHLSNVEVRFQDGAFSMEAQKAVTLKAWGGTTLDPEAQTLTLTLEKIRAGILPVPIRSAFVLMKKVLTQPFVRLLKPDVVLDLGAFLQ